MNTLITTVAMSTRSLYIIVILISLIAVLVVDNQFEFAKAEVVQSCPTYSEVVGANLFFCAKETTDIKQRARCTKLAGFCDSAHYTFITCNSTLNELQIKANSTTLPTCVNKMKEYVSDADANKFCSEKSFGPWLSSSCGCPTSSDLSDLVSLTNCVLNKIAELPPSQQATFSAYKCLQEEEGTKGTPAACNSKTSNLFKYSECERLVGDVIKDVTQSSVDICSQLLIGSLTQHCSKPFNKALDAFCTATDVPFDEQTIVGLPAPVFVGIVVGIGVTFLLCIGGAVWAFHKSDPDKKGTLFNNNLGDGDSGNKILSSGESSGEKNKLKPMIPTSNGSGGQNFGVFSNLQSIQNLQQTQQQQQQMMPNGAAVPPGMVVIPVQTPQGVQMMVVPASSILPSPGMPSMQPMSQNGQSMMPMPMPMSPTSLPNMPQPQPLQQTNPPPVPPAPQSMPNIAPLAAKPAEGAADKSLDAETLKLRKQQLIEFCK